MASLLAVLAVLEACASAPRTSGEWLAGRLSLSVAALDAQPARNVTAAFELRGDGTRGDLHLFTPLGTQIAAASWAPGLATLATADGERSFADLDALAIGAFGALGTSGTSGPPGAQVPLAALPDWLGGRAWPGAPSTANESGFDQLGWHVDLSRRADGRIVARRAAPPAVELRVQLDRADG
ncbi:MAG: outer membrane lipoprotein LolB [Burkholderiales bacterium]|nr:outer membrane lipoprotein LolB [Burkholderiales bacterium]